MLVARFKMRPSVPSAPCSITRTTVWRKFGSFSDGLATKKAPLATEDGLISDSAPAGVPSRTVSRITSSIPTICTIFCISITSTWLADQLSKAPGKEQDVHRAKEQRKTDFAVRPPLTVLSQRPGRMDDRWITVLLGERFMPVAVSMEIHEQLGVRPLG